MRTIRPTSVPHPERSHLRRLARALLVSLVTLAVTTLIVTSVQPPIYAPLPMAMTQAA